MMLPKLDVHLLALDSTKSLITITLKETEHNFKAFNNLYKSGKHIDEK